MLKELDIQITNKCPLTCRHCCCSSGPHERIGAETEQWIKIIRDAAALGVKRIDITGGEPFLRSDIGIIVEEIASHGMAYEIQSTWIPKDNLLEFDKRINVISLDGLETNHDYYRGQGSFSRAIKNIEKLLRQNATVRITTVVTNRNQQDIEPLIEFSGNLGIDIHAFFCFSPIGRGKQITDDWIVPNDHVAIGDRVHQFLKTTTNPLPSKVYFQIGYSSADGPWRYSIGCRAASGDFLFILANGITLPCSWYIDTPVNVGNAFESGLNGVYKNYLQYLERLKKNSQVCSDCSLFSVCNSGCDAARVRFHSRIDPRCTDPSSFFPGCPERKVTLLDTI
jgi:radical SAM protein with 4Fe4S-binding SPASM domain